MAQVILVEGMAVLTLIQLQRELMTGRTRTNEITSLTHRESLPLSPQLQYCLTDIGHKWRIITVPALVTYSGIIIPFSVDSHSFSTNVFLLKLFAKSCHIMLSSELFIIAVIIESNRQRGII